MVEQNVCPWQGGPLLAASLRKIAHNPRRIVRPYLTEGMTAMDIGCGMGFFTIPMSDIAGSRGNVIAVDLQPEMLAGLQQKAQKAGVENIAYHQCGNGLLNLRQWNGTADFALIFMMLHETPDAGRLIREVYDALTPGGKLLLSEPIVHVKKKAFQNSVSLIQKTGFNVIASPMIPFCRTKVFRK
jgi:ubiquinone/menaquinone biosynthesis C-methylase UbiE